MAKGNRRAGSSAKIEGPDGRHSSNDDTTADDAQALKRARLDYMRQMLKELRAMAQETNEGTLVYLLDVAILEISENAELAEFRQELRD